MKYLKKAFTTLIFIACGISAGYLIAHLPLWNKALTEDGDYRAYLRSERVLVYGREGCPYCKQARDYLMEKKIAFDYLDVQENSRANTEYKTLGKGGVPLILTSHRLIHGFAPHEIDRVLAQPGKQ